jgi:hypothetical protein
MNTVLKPFQKPFNLISKGILKCLCWPSGFLEAWCAKAKKHSFLENVWFVDLGAPGLNKTTWLKNHFGILLVERYFMLPKFGPEVRFLARKRYCVT